MIPIGKQQSPSTRAAQSQERASASRTSTDTNRSRFNPFATALPEQAAEVPAFSLETKKAKSTTTATQSVTADSAVKALTMPGTIDFSQFTDVAIDRQASIAYGKAAESRNYAIDYLYNQAMENWELNGRRGPQPVKVAHHESDPEKIFQHLQGFRYGGIAIPDDGSGYLSVQGYVSASPHQQQYGKPAEQLTAHNGTGYQQVMTPSNPATPRTSDIYWGPATESFKA